MHLRHNKDLPKIKIKIANILTNKSYHDIYLMICEIIDLIDFHSIINLNLNPVVYKIKNTIRLKLHVSPIFFILKFLNVTFKKFSTILSNLKLYSK
jgi:hypothetical protein